MTSQSPNEFEIAQERMALKTNLPATAASILDFAKPQRVHNCPRADGIKKRIACYSSNCPRLREALTNSHLSNNLLEPPGTSWNLLYCPAASPEPPGASWNLLEPPGVSWSFLESPGASLELPWCLEERPWSFPRPPQDSLGFLSPSPRLPSLPEASLGHSRPLQASPAFPRPHPAPPWSLPGAACSFLEPPGASLEPPGASLIVPGASPGLPRTP